ncbi:MAG: SDR family NAD(P)-dependent oxidoreductase [Thermoguttaceae bacterium]
MDSTTDSVITVKTLRESSMIDYELKNKVVLITGTNNPKGIGAACALAFAKQGAKVALVYKKLSFPYDDKKTVGDGFDWYYKAQAGDCAEVENELQKLGASYLVIKADISDEGAIPAMFDKIEDALGTVNILVNNAAGYTENDSIFTTNDTAIKSIYGVNVGGTVMMTKEFVKRLTGNRFSEEKSLQEILVNYGKFEKQSNANIYGRVINFSTDRAQINAGEICYGSSKAAVEALTRAIAMEVGFLGITVNAVAPGPTQTGWMNDELVSAVLPEIPLGRIGTPQDIADTVLFLASNKASWLSGQVIKVSGGHGL